MTDSFAPVWSMRVFKDCIRAFNNLIPDERISACLLPIVLYICLLCFIPLILIEMWYRFGKGIQEWVR